MDALITLVLRISGSAIENKDTIILIGIFCVGLKQVFQTRIKQTACDKIHDFHAQQIVEVKRDSKEALNLANKAHTCTILMTDSFKKIEKSVDDLIAGKYTNAKKEEKAS